MSECYYLMAQLPDISLLSPEVEPPITEERFRELCERALSGKELKMLDSLSLVPPKGAVPTGSEFLDKWYASERNLRLCLASIRAKNIGKEAEEVVVDSDISQVAHDACEMNNPLQAELFLHKYRQSVLTSLHPSDMFSIDAVYEYGIRLMLDARMRKFNLDAGEAAMQTVYDAILEGTM